MLHFADRILEAATELRHVEYIVDLGEVRRQFQSVCHGSTSGKDTERANVARSQLAFDPETMSASHRGDTEVSIFTRLILHFLVLAIIVALLTRLSSFQMFTNNANLIFSMLYDVRTNESSFSSFGPIQRGSTLTSIENFEGCHLQTSLIAIVVRQFSKWKRFLPFLTE